MSWIIPLLYWIGFVLQAALPGGRKAPVPARRAPGGGTLTPAPPAELALLGAPPPLEQPPLADPAPEQGVVLQLQGGVNGPVTPVEEELLNELNDDEINELDEERLELDDDENRLPLDDELRELEEEEKITDEDDEPRELDDEGNTTLLDELLEGIPPLLVAKRR